MVDRIRHRGATGGDERCFQFEMRLYAIASTVGQKQT